MNRALSPAAEDGSRLAPIDTAALLARCLDNVAFAGLLLGELQATGGGWVDEIARHAASGDARAAAEAAHSLKGAAGIVAAEPLRALAAAAEAAGRAGEVDRVSSLVHVLRCEMARCLVEAARFRERSAGDSTSERPRDRDGR